MLNHLAQIRKALKRYQVDAFFISSVPHISYLTGYLHFSSTEREAYLLITKKHQYIFTDARYTEAVEKQVSQFQLVEIGGGTSSLSDRLKDIVKKESIKVLGVEESNLTISEHKKLLEIVPQVKELVLESLRIIKESWEVVSIRKACRLGDLAFAYIRKKIKPGMSEAQVAWELERFIRDHGGKLSFDTIVAFGKNASVPHHHPGKAKLANKKGEFILLDFGVKMNGYASDMTRSIFWGRASEKQKEIYETVLEAQRRAVVYIKKNIKKKILAKEVDRVAREYVKERGFPNIPHSLGHGIGLEVHESPNLSPRSPHTLEEGMVFSIEPGIYLPGFGGVRIEDLYFIQNGRLKELTRSPKGLIEIA